MGANSKRPPAKTRQANKGLRPERGERSSPGTMTVSNSSPFAWWMVMISTASGPASTSGKAKSLSRLRAKSPKSVSSPASSSRSSSQKNISASSKPELTNGAPDRETANSHPFGNQYPNDHHRIPHTDA
jgi:hypothetical protein